MFVSDDLKTRFSTARDRAEDVLKSVDGYSFPIL